MTTHGESMGQTKVVEKVLRSMTSKFNYVVCSIEESNDVTALTIDELQSSLLVHEQRMQYTLEKDEEQALKVSSAGRGGNRGRGRNGGRGRGRGRQSKELVECYRCHKLGHYQNECPTWEEGANYAEFNEKEEVLLMAQESSKEEVYDESNVEMWFLDSGCSNHMVGRKDWLFNFDDSFRDFVKLGDNSKMPVLSRVSDSCVM